MEKQTNAEEFTLTGEEVSVSRLDTERKNAGFWIRVGALALDVIVLQTIFTGIYLLVGYSRLEPPFFITVIELLIACAYYAGMTMAWGQTLGKMATGIQVVRRDGRPNGFGNVVFRETIGKCVSFLTLCIGFLMVGWNREKRALHDLMAGTQVVKVSK